MPKQTKGRVKRGLHDPTESIREAIASGRFHPNERLVEESLSQLFRANRSAVRLALARLEQEGLVVREPNRGARVRVVLPHEAVQLAEARSVLEALIARHAATNVTPADADELRGIQRELERLYAAGDLMAYLSENVRLHSAIVRIANQEVAAKLLRGLRYQSVSAQFRSFLQPGRPTESVSEHAALVDAIVSGDPDAAEHAMRSHLDAAVESVKRAIASLAPDGHADSAHTEVD
ncbi:MAG TPA: GntR family transcriptional regulator [Candidatus Dormibacteraeota bacterium]|nr:GntR family transcriptional regulator [Candidatus Dormibacteraeota bacterium]